MRSCASLASLVAMLAVLLSLAKPDRPPKALPSKAKAVLPVLPKTCVYGEIHQAGNEVVVKGSSWKAIGRIREDGRLWLLWTSPLGEPCPAVYNIEGNALRGGWGYAGRVLLTADGSLVGEVVPDVIHGEP